MALTGHIRQLVEADAAMVSSLRAGAYRDAPGFRVIDASALGWGERDRQAIVLGVFRSDGVLLATLRGLLARCPDSATAYLDNAFDICSLGLSFPIFITGRGATRRGFEGLGLNSLLRLRLVELAFGCGCAGMLATVVVGAPRTRTMRQMGCKFERGRACWSGYLESTAPVALAHLDLTSHRVRATRELQLVTQGARANFPSIGDDQWTAAITRRV